MAYEMCVSAHTKWDGDWQCHVSETFAARKLGTVKRWAFDPHSSPIKKVMREFHKLSGTWDASIMITLTNQDCYDDVMTVDYSTYDYGTDKEWFSETWVKGIGSFSEQ